MHTYAFSNLRSALGACDALAALMADCCFRSRSYLIVATSKPLPLHMATSLSAQGDLTDQAHVSQATSPDEAALMFEKAISS